MLELKLDYVHFIGSCFKVEEQNRHRKGSCPAQVAIRLILRGL